MAEWMHRALLREATASNAEYPNITRREKTRNTIQGRNLERADDGINVEPGVSDQTLIRAPNRVRLHELLMQSAATVSDFGAGAG